MESKEDKWCLKQDTDDGPFSGNSPKSKLSVFWKSCGTLKIYVYCVVFFFRTPPFKKLK